jgi:TolA-binding protein
MPKQKQDYVPDAIRASLLRVGADLEEQGMVHQALTSYMKLIKQYPNTQEASVAAENILTIAEGMRKRGQHHMAMTVIDQLDTAIKAGGAEGKV